MKKNLELKTTFVTMACLFGLLALMFATSATSICYAQTVRQAAGRCARWRAMRSAISSSPAVAVAT